jgi:hypothetical protein
MQTVFQKNQLTKFLNNINKSWQCCFATISTVVEPKVIKCDSREWNEAKHYRTIPGPSTLSLIRGFAPGGTYYGFL